MALTQISTNGIKDATIATADIADDAVTADKLANAINTDIAAKAVLTGSTNNTITTVTGANAIQGEANLTYDGDILQSVGGGSSADGSRLDLKHGNNNTTDVISSVTFSNTVGEAARIQGETSGANNSGVITFHTDNAGTSAERLRIDSSGKVGIGTTSPAFELHVGGSGQQDLLVGSTNAGGARLILDGDSNGDGSGGDFAEITNTTGGDLDINARNPASDAVITFSNNGSERVRIDSSGRLLIGHNASIEKHRHVQLVGTGADESAYLAARFSNDANCPRFETLKSRSGTPGSNTIVQQNDEVGAIEFLADDGVEYNNQVAGIKAWIDAAPGANDTPGRLCFYTTSDGAMAQTERMRIDRHGRMYLGTTTTGESGADDLTIENTSADMGITLRSGTSNNGSLFFADGTSGSAQYAGFLQYVHAEDDLYVGAGGTTKLKVQGNGNVRINDGDLVIGTAGHGIDFSANSHASAMSSELLDDYEVGEWSPTFYGANTAGTATVNHTTGNYTKIGNLVHLNYYSSAFAMTGSAGTAEIGNLPFTAEAGGDNYSCIVFSHTTCFTSAASGYVNQSQSTMTILVAGDTTTSNTYENSGGKYLMFSVTYRAA